eukprot:TRINITY_DN13475_c0_g1_i1.p1 TRINITY_DN13475_c0_g1~~TRINITY_DN13475_c0_g1_i1.p1  ORF type:complete len:251 (-),score=56.00 TRINITY_DN13475_c0_g1_i1:46-798(-)
MCIRDSIYIERKSFWDSIMTLLKAFSAIFIICTLFLCSNSIFITLSDQNPVCFWKIGWDGNNMTGSYVVSGYHEDEISFWIDNPENQTVHKTSRVRDHNFNLPLLNYGKYRLCFQALDSTTKVISFDFATSESRTPQNVAAKDHVDEIYRDVKKSYKQLEIIYRNQHYQQVREETHRRTLKDTESKVQWCGLSKIFVLVAITALQIFVLTSFFKNKQRILVQVRVCSYSCLLYTSPSPRDGLLSRMPSSA